MSDLPKYPKVLTLGATYTENALVGEVILQEKVDGSQLRFGWDDEEKFRVFSKNQEIHKEAAGMFEAGVKSVMNKDGLYKNTTLFGEYLQKPKHNTLKYEKTPTNHIVIFDGLDDTGWMTRDTLQGWAEYFNVDLIPEFYVGEIKNYRIGAGEKFDRTKGWNATDFLKRINGQTMSYLGGELIEGTVIKNYNQTIEVYGVLRPVFAKYVREEFKERHQKNPEFRPKKQTIQDYLTSFRSESRWLKAVQHLRDEGKLENEPRDIGTLIKLVQQDIDEEETENIKNYLYGQYIKDIKYIATSGLPEWYKEKLLENVK